MCRARMRRSPRASSPLTILVSQAARERECKCSLLYKGARHWTQISDPQRAMHSLLVASSSALALRARPPQLVASSSAARAARSPTTARRKLLCGSRCALAHHSSSQAPRWLALRAHPPQLVVASSALALRARSRCALARHSSSQAYRALVLLDGRCRKLPLPSVRSRLRPCGSEIGPAWHLFGLLAAPQTWRGASARPRLAAVKRLGSNNLNEPQEPPSPPTPQTTPRTQGHNSARLIRRARGPFESGG